MQESGVPNVTGFQEFGTKTWYSNGVFRTQNNNSDGISGGRDGPDGITIDLSRGSNQYINNLKEVRVKSIISIGFIKLY